MILFSRFGRVAVAAATVALVSGCGEDWAQNLSVGGKALPDARLHVSLAEPVPSHELFQRLEDVARRAGFPYRRSSFPPILPGEAKIDGTYHAWGWHPSERSSSSNFFLDYQIGISWEETLDEPQEFDFIFHNNSFDDFTALEWMLFYRWKDFYFPTEFPGSAISITLHPAQYNSCEDTANIAKLTGIFVPEKTADVCEWWRKENRDN